MAGILVVILSKVDFFFKKKKKYFLIKISQKSIFLEIFIKKLLLLLEIPLNLLLWKKEKDFKILFKKKLLLDMLGALEGAVIFQEFIGNKSKKRPEATEVGPSCLKKFFKNKQK